MRAGTVLIVEDDLTIAENLYAYLQRQGLMPDVAYEDQGALARLRAASFDAMVLDLGLPGPGGLEVLRAMQREPALACPVLVLTARDRLEDKLLAFELGADDYLVKPFSLAEVLARLRVLVRRARQASPQAWSYGPLQYDVHTHAVLVSGQPLPLPRKSVLLLEMLLRHAGGLVSHARLTAALWPEGPPSERALHDQLHLLRRRLREAHGPDIVAVPGQGWQLVPAATASLPEPLPERSSRGPAG